MDPDSISVTESWCNDQVTDAFLTLPGYELVQDLRKDRFDTDRGRGGGLLVYAKKELSICVIPTDHDDANFQCCKFKVKDLVFLFNVSVAKQWRCKFFRYVRAVAES
jgi:hypothetical protein